MKSTIKYISLLFVAIVLTNTILHAKVSCRKISISIIKEVKFGTLTGIIKNESGVALTFTNDISKKGLHLTIHEVFEYTITKGKQKAVEYEMGEELQNYTVRLNKISETTYSYKIVNVPLNKKFIIRCNTSNIDKNTPISTLANLNFIGAITYIVQKRFNLAKYIELVNIINEESTTSVKNIFIKN